ncbi:MAG: Ppx/GppA phosphatase family protein [Candidatus Dormibacteria bacterium]
MTKGQGPVAVIDVGSNSARVVVVDDRMEGHLEILSSLRIPLHLARETGPGESLGPAAVQATIAAIEEFALIARAAGATRTVAVATAAVRESANAAMLVDAVHRATGITLEVIDGVTEALYGFLGAVHGLPVQSGAVLDMGGGSTEISTFRDRELRKSWTLPVGSLRLAGEFLLTDPPQRTEVAALAAQVRDRLEQAGVPVLAEGQSLVATGGSVRNLARLHQRQRAYPIERVHGYRMTRSEVRELSSELAAMSSEQRAATPGIKRDRADSIVCGSLALVAIMEWTQAVEVTIAGQGLREGLVYAQVGSGLPPTETVRAASVRALASRFSTWSESAAERRVNLTTALSHGVPGRRSLMTELLRHGATLLDIGRSIDYYDRYAHAAGVIAESDLEGFTHEEVASLSAMVRRAGDAGTSYKPFGDLISAEARPRIEQAAVLLALADEIERRTPPGAAPVVRCSSTQQSLVIRTAGGPGWWSEMLDARVRRAFDLRLRVEPEPPD